MGKDLRKRGERVHCGSMTSAGWPNAAYGDQSTEGKCRVGYVIGLMSPTLRRTSKFAGKTVKSSVGGEVHALSEMVDRMLLLEERSGPFDGLRPGVV